MSEGKPFAVDVRRLLEPISPEQPSGEWLRYEGAYDRIQEARREDDASLPQGIWQTTQKRANWSEVSLLCQEMLRTRSKDLQIVAWMLEAWLRLYGYRGLVEGIRLITELSTRFWDTMFPQIDDGDTSYRVAPIEWIDQKLPLVLKLLPLTAPTGDARPYSFSDWEQALRRENMDQMPQRGQGEHDPDSVTKSQFMTSMSLTPRSLLRLRAKDLDDAQREIAGLETNLDRLMGREFVALRQMRQAIQQIRRLFDEMLGSEAEQPTTEREQAMAQDDAPEDADAQDAPAAEQGRGLLGGRVQSRAEAYKRLEEAADFLQRTEPHSPTPYLVRRAVSWGRMSLTELLAEIVATPSDLHVIYQLLGMKGPE